MADDLKGPNEITREYSTYVQHIASTLAAAQLSRRIWKSFMPSHSFQVFQRGAYFSTEVVPDALAVISLNTLYFYDSNKGTQFVAPIRLGLNLAVTAVGGCEWSDRNDAGNLEFDWLEVELSSFRSRGMYVSCQGEKFQPPTRSVSATHTPPQVYLTGHVPPSPGNYFPECVRLSSHSSSSAARGLDTRFSTCGTPSLRCDSKTRSSVTFLGYVRWLSNPPTPPGANCIGSPLLLPRPANTACASRVRCSSGPHRARTHARHRPAPRTAHERRSRPWHADASARGGADACPALVLFPRGGRPRAAGGRQRGAARACRRGRGPVRDTHGRLRRAAAPQGHGRGELRARERGPERRARVPADVPRVRVQRNGPAGSPARNKGPAPRAPSRAEGGQAEVQGRAVARYLALPAHGEVALRPRLAGAHEWPMDPARLCTGERASPPRPAERPGP
jgi:hypothetical protein